MATTLKEFEGMGIDTKSEDFKRGYEYARKPASVQEFKATVGLIVGWAQNRKKRA